MIRRRHLLLTAAALATPALGQTAIPFRLSTAGAENDWLAQSLNRMKAGLDAELPGQFAVAVHPASSLFRQGTEVPALQRGTLELSTMTTFEVEQQLPELGAFSAGYAIRDFDHAAKLFNGPIGEEFAATVAARMGIVILSMAYLGTRQVNLRTAREVRGPADFAGVKLRMPAGPGWVALGRGLGVTPQPMAMPEVYLALRTGAIDGQENPLALTRANNLHEVTKQLVLTSHLVQPVFFAVAKPWFDRLSAPQQAAIRRQARESADWNNQRRVGEEAELVGFFEGAGMTVTRPPLDGFRAAVTRQYAESGIAARWAPGLVERIAAA